MNTVRTAKFLRIRANRRGFTLIETLVALVIAAIAAAVILSQVRTLMLRAEKEQSHQLAVLQLLNDSLRATHGGFAKLAVPRLEQDELQIEAQAVVNDEKALPLVKVRNFLPNGGKLPPISFAYTPFQLFITEQDRYAIHSVSAALPSPVVAYDDPPSGK